MNTLLYLITKNGSKQELLCADWFKEIMKTPRICPYVQQQFLKDGKTDAEIKAILEGIIPHILEKSNQRKGDSSFYLGTNSGGS